MFPPLKQQHTMICSLCCSFDGDGEAYAAVSLHLVVLVGRRVEMRMCGNKDDSLRCINCWLIREILGSIEIVHTLARGNVASNFQEDHWPKAVASGQAHWSTEHHGRLTSEAGH